MHSNVFQTLIILGYFFQKNKTFSGPQSGYTRFVLVVILALAWDRIAWAWASWAETTGPLCDSPPARNCQPHTHTKKNTIKNKWSFTLLLQWDS